VKSIKHLNSVFHQFGRFFAAPIAVVVAFTRSVIGSPIRLAALSLAFMLVSAVALVQAQSTVVYVDINNGDPNPPDLGQNGWGDDAYQFLQDALAAAEELMNPPFDLESVDIWVAAGVYKPDHDAANPDGTCEDFGGGWIFCDTDATFTIPNNVRIFGGFVGDGTESSLDERNGGVHDPTLTILTGDLADGASAPQFASDAYSANVVTFENTDSTARLDTVTVKRGWSMTALFDDSSGILSNSIVTESAGNGVNVKGTGIPRMINCQFIHNQGLNGSSAPTGALTIQTGANATVVNSLFYNNEACCGSDGGAVQVQGQVNCPGTCAETNITLINCTIVKNTADGDGGGIYRIGEGLTLIKNSILWDNEDSSGSTESAQIHDGGGGGGGLQLLTQPSSI